MSTYGVVLFQNAHDAIVAERLARTKFQVDLMPVPRQFSTDCGIALRFIPEHLEKIGILLNQNQISCRLEIVSVETDVKESAYEGDDSESS